MRRRLILGVLAAVAAVLIVFLAGFFLGRWRTRREAVSSAPVVQAVRRIARLATIEMEIADVVRYEEVKTVLVFDIPKNATLRLRGKVMGGFDLARGFDVEADAARRLVTVRLPAPQVLAIDDRLEWFNERSGWLNPITPGEAADGVGSRCARPRGQRCRPSRKVIRARPRPVHGCRLGLRVDGQGDGERLARAARSPRIRHRALRLRSYSGLDQSPALRILQRVRRDEDDVHEPPDAAAAEREELQEAETHVADVEAVDTEGAEVAADWDHLESPETYLGGSRGERFVPSISR